MKKINVKKDRKEIARIIGIHLDLMVEKKNNKGIIINYPMVENIADCILLYIITEKSKTANKNILQQKIVTDNYDAKAHSEVYP